MGLRVDGRKGLDMAWLIDEVVFVFVNRRGRNGRCLLTCGNFLQANWNKALLVVENALVVAQRT